MLIYWIFLFLLKAFFVQSINITFGNYRRPGAIKIEKSTDVGTSYLPWHYLVTNPASSQCQEIFGVQAFRGTIDRVDEVLCTEYSRYVPPEYNETVGLKWGTSVYFLQQLQSLQFWSFHRSTYNCKAFQLRKLKPKKGQKQLRPLSEQTEIKTNFVISFKFKHNYNSLDSLFQCLKIKILMEYTALGGAGWERRRTFSGGTICYHSQKVGKCLSRIPGSLYSSSWAQAFSKNDSKNS